MNLIFDAVSVKTTSQRRLFSSWPKAAILLRRDSWLHRHNDIASPIEHAVSRQTDDRSAFHSLSIQLNGNSLANHNSSGRNETNEARNTNQCMLKLRCRWRYLILKKRFHIQYSSNPIISSSKVVHQSCCPAHVDGAICNFIRAYSVTTNTTICETGLLFM